MRMILILVISFLHFNYATASCNCSTTNNTTNATLSEAIQAEIANSCDRDPWQKHCQTTTVVPTGQQPAAQAPCPPQRTIND